MSIYNDIRATLETHLANTPGVPPIAPQNVIYEPVNGQPYVKTTLVPTLRRPAVRGLNPQLRYDGLFSILICTSQGDGSGAGYDVADMLLDRFAPTTDISLTGNTGSILQENGDNLLLEDGNSLLLDVPIILSIDYSEVGTSYLDPPFYCTPITVAWYIYN